MRAPRDESSTGAVKNAVRHARVTMNTRSGACGTGCRSARRWHGPIGAARIATYLHARFPMLNLDNMVHNALDITIINSMHHQQFSSTGTSRAPRAGAFDAQMPRASHTLPPGCEPPRATPHALPFAPHSLLSSLCSLLHSTFQATCTRVPAWPGQRMWKQDGARSHSAQAAAARAMRQRRNRARRAPQCCE